MAPCSVVGRCLGEVTGAPFCVNGKMVMFLTAKESAKELGISESAFRRAVKRGELPQARITCRPNLWSIKELEDAACGPSINGPGPDKLAVRIREYQHEVCR